MTLVVLDYPSDSLTSFMTVRQGSCEMEIKYGYHCMCNPSYQGEDVSCSTSRLLPMRLQSFHTDITAKLQWVTKPKRIIHI